MIETTAAPHRVSLETRGHILVIRMERQNKRNTVDPHMTAALDQALNTLEYDPDLWRGVLVGGEKAFSAGTDLADTAGTARAAHLDPTRSESARTATDCRAAHRQLRSSFRSRESPATASAHPDDPEVLRDSVERRSRS